MHRQEERRHREGHQLLHDKFECTLVHKREALKLQPRQTRSLLCPVINVN
jgi:hypothetical protein